MATEIFPFQARTTLTAAIDAVVTTLPVAAFPLALTAGQQTTIVIGHEEILVLGPVSLGATSVTGVGRGAGTSTAATHVIGSVVYGALTPTSLGNHPLGGDLGGTIAAGIAKSIQGQSVSSAAGTKGQFLMCVLGAAALAFTSLTGDVSASASTPGLMTVTQLQSQPLSASAVAKGQFLMGTAASAYGPASISGDIAASTSTAGALTVTGLSGAAGTVTATATSLSFSQASTISSSAGAMTYDSFAALNIGTSAATSIAMGKSGITTTITGGLTQQTGAAAFNTTSGFTVTASGGSVSIDCDSGHTVTLCGSTGGGMFLGGSSGYLRAQQNLTPASDLGNTLGLSTRRWSNVIATHLSVYIANTDTQPSAQLQTSQFLMGPGGSSGFDCGFARSGTSILQVTNASTTIYAQFGATTYLDGVTTQVGPTNATTISIGNASANISIGATAGSFGSGTGVVFVANAATAPTTNPTGGGVLYTAAGALKFRGSSGTVTTLAPA